MNGKDIRDDQWVLRDDVAIHQYVTQTTMENSQWHDTGATLYLHDGGLCVWQKSCNLSNTESSRYHHLYFSALYQS